MLIGDLHEQFERGRSRSWYWRQAVEASVLSSVGDLLAQKLPTFRALVLGWAMLLFCNFVVLSPLSRFDEWLFTTGLVSHYVGWQWPVGEALPVALLGASSGWIVGRTHRVNAVPITFAFAFSVAVYSTARIGWVLYEVAVSPHMMWMVSWPSLFLTKIAAPLGVLVGGLLSTPSRVTALATDSPSAPIALR
jgi:hypothetical protein